MKERLQEVVIDTSAAKKWGEVAAVTEERRWEENRRVLRRRKKNQKREKSEFIELPFMFNWKFIFVLTLKRKLQNCPWCWICVYLSLLFYNKTYALGEMYTFYRIKPLTHLNHKLT